MRTVTAILHLIAPDLCRAAQSPTRPAVPEDWRPMVWDLVAAGLTPEHAEEFVLQAIRSREQRATAAPRRTTEPLPVLRRQRGSAVASLGQQGAASVQPVRRR